MDQTRNQLLHQQQLSELAKSNQCSRLTQIKIEETYQARKETSGVENHILNMKDMKVKGQHTQVNISDASFRQTKQQHQDMGFVSPSSLRASSISQGSNFPAQPDSEQDTPHKVTEEEEEEEGHSLFSRDFGGVFSADLPNSNFHPAVNVSASKISDKTPVASNLKEDSTFSSIFQAPHGVHLEGSQGFSHQGMPMINDQAFPSYQPQFNMMVGYQNQPLLPHDMLAKANHHSFETHQQIDPFLFERLQQQEHQALASGGYQHAGVFNQQLQGHQISQRQPTSRHHSSQKLQREWQNEGRQIKIHGLSKENYLKLIKPRLTALSLNISKENFKKDDIIINLETQQEAMITLNTVNQVLQQVQTPDLLKVKVSRQLESIQERDDSDNNGSSHSGGEKNDNNIAQNLLKEIDLARERTLFLEQDFDEDDEQHDVPEVEYFKEEEQLAALNQQQQIFMQPSPFFVGKTQMMAQSLVDKPPMAFTAEGELIPKSHRAYTPLDQITTGISDEDTIHYNLSQNQHSYSFNQSADAFQAFHYRQQTHHSSENSSSFHSAHANVPNSFNVQFRPSHDMQMMSQFPIQYGQMGHNGVPQMQPTIGQRHSNPTNSSQQYLTNAQPSPFTSVLIPSSSQTLYQVDPVTGQPTGYVINPLSSQPHILVTTNDQAYQQLTRNAQFQTQNSWPYNQGGQIPIQQHLLHPGQVITPSQLSRLDMQMLQEQQIQHHSRMMAQEFKKQSNSQEVKLATSSSTGMPQSSTTSDLQQVASLSKQFSSQLQVRDDKELEAPQLSSRSQNVEEIKSSQSVSQTSFQNQGINSNAPDFQPSSSFASSTNTEERVSNEVDIYKILKGEESRTTIMVRNIPNKFKQLTLLDMINSKHHNKYDYFYLPMDLKTQCNVGYAFINFTHPIYILDFFLEFQSIEWSIFTHDCKSGKICKLAFANIQGKDELVQHHFDKNIMKKTEEQIKPLVLDSRQISEEEIKKIKDKYANLKRQGDLDKRLAKLSRKQKRATVHNGPHPHHQPLETQQYQSSHQQSSNHSQSHHQGSSSMRESQHYNSSSNYHNTVRQVTIHAQGTSRQQPLSSYGHRNQHSQAQSYSNSFSGSYRGSANHGGPSSSYKKSAGGSYSSQGLYQSSSNSKQNSSYYEGNYSNHHHSQSHNSYNYSQNHGYGQSSRNGGGYYGGSKGNQSSSYYDGSRGGHHYSSSHHYQ